MELPRLRLIVVHANTSVVALVAAPARSKGFDLTAAPAAVRAGAADCVPKRLDPASRRAHSSRRRFVRRPDAFHVEHL